ncbi:hypothetical protein [Deinococcus aquaticus]|uniref:Nucleotidyltransferase n=2 Tax=Deinococcus aquaticus TaxID=328692 RepID=A0ABY7V5X3_9DEIO|nr:hypothetical protein [Deinococcus aquaticus]WDA60602.1 hypothetical protein M8445_17850 [Deinococcus aquaticus]
MTRSTKRKPQNAATTRKKAAKGQLPQTVEGALRSFARRHIDLTATEVAQARRSRTFLIQRLKTLTSRDSMPRLTGAFMPFGSFARRTKIRPLDDIDLLVIIRGTDLRVDGWGLPTEIKLKPVAGTWPPRYLDPAGHLNSRVVLNGLKAHVASIPQYRTTAKRISGQAVVLKPSTKAWTFDLVPAVAVRDPRKAVTHYLIPNGKGAWMITDPRRDALKTRQSSAQVAGAMYETVRLVKYWNRRGGKPRLGSYHLEVMAMEGLTNQPFLTADPLAMLETCLRHISTRVYYHYPDPKGLVGPIDEGVSFDARQKVAQAARTAAEHVRQAAAQRQDSRTARTHLQRVFGAEFPKWASKAASGS